MRIKTSHLTRASLLLAVFFGLDKGVAILRQVIIARQFGLSSELDAFNVANNLPDMLYALISGGALALAFIPILTEVLTRDGRRAAWDLFSKIVNLVFIVTALLSVVVFFLARSLVGWEVGIAPGFGPQQQELVITLMRLNLVATLIFSISGLVMAGLQANQHFLLPAMAPIFYNFGQILGALILSPEQGYQIGPITLPALGMGVEGLVVGVIAGALMHLGIQIPGLIKYQFHWVPKLGLRTPDVQKVLRLMGPRMLTVFFVQMIFLLRDNLASRLEEGSVSALTYGWMIMQVPETLIGTAIGTALLPTLSEHFSKSDLEAFRSTVERAIKVLLVITLPVAVIIGAGLQPLLQFAFGFEAGDTNLLLWTTRGFLVGLVGHCLLEVAARSFYARQDALTPLLGGVLNILVYLLVGTQLYRWLGAAGISLTDSVAYTLQSLFLLLFLAYRRSIKLVVTPSLLKGLLGAFAAGGVIVLFNRFVGFSPALISGLLAMGLGTITALPFVWKDLRLLARL